MKLNLANRLTMTRIVIAFLIMFILLFSFSEINITFPKYLVQGVYIDTKYILVGILFIVAFITDLIDGKIARKRNMVTKLGGLLDNIADKVLVNSTLILLAAYGFINPAIAVLVIIRDIFTSTIKMAGGEALKTTKIAKIKSWFLNIGIILTLFYNMPFEIYGLDIANFCLLIGTASAIACKAIVVLPEDSGP